MKKILFVFVLSFIFSASFSQDPTYPPNNLAFTTINQTSFTFTWTRGNGDYCLVVVRPSANSITHPVDLNTYVGSSSYTSGSNLGNSSYVVYKGTGTSLTVSNLSIYTSYTVVIYECNTGSFPYPALPYYLTTSYETGSHYTLTTPPTTPVTNLTATSITASGATLSWTSGDGTYDFLTLKASTSNTDLPVDGNSYVASSSYGSGSAIGSGSPYSYAVYYSSGTSVAVSNLSASTNYVANACPYNGLSGGQNYYLSGYPTKGFTTLATEPTGSSGWAYISDISDTAFTVNWLKPTSGAGIYSLVTIKLGSSNNDLPVDGALYTPNTIYGSGTALPGGAYAVYTSTGNSVRVTGLTKNTNYTAAVFEFNGGAGTYNNTYNYYSSSYVTQLATTKDNEPTLSSSGLTLTPGTTSVTATWSSNGNGARRLVTVKPSRIKTALALDGTNDYVNVPYNAALQPTTALTLEAWVYKSSWTSVASCQTIAGNYDNNSGYGIFLCGSTAYAYIRRNSSFTNPSTTFTYLTPGWHHFAMTYDGRYTDLWIDGAKKAENDAGGVYPIDYPDANQFCIGVQAGATTTPLGLYWNGYIDEVRVWNIARSTLNLRNYMNETMAGNETGLAAEWKMDDGFVTTGTAANNSLNSTSLNGTLTNMTTTAASSFTGTSGWVKSGAVVDAPSDYTTHGASSVFMSGALIKNGVYAVYNNTGNSVAVTGLTPGVYYNFSVYELNNNTNNNYLVTNYLTGDVQTTAQPVPTVTISPTSGSVGTIVTISGTNFDGTAANNTVYFGATKATVLTASTVQLTVVVPYCANYVPVSVAVNTAKGVSRTPFVVTTSCSASISGSSFTGTTTTTTGALHAGVFAKDIDKDGKSDLLFVDDGNDRFSVLRNQSANGSISWGSQYNYSTNTSPQFVIADDIDGDEKPDVFVSCSSTPATIDIFRNTSSVGSVSFATKIQIATSSGPSQMSLADFDKDGKLDLVVGHGSGGSLQVYRNTSSVGIISFDTPLSIPGLSDSYSVKTADLNGDGLIDIIVGDRSANTISIIPNTSTVGNLSAGAIVNISPTSGPQCIAIGDFDNNGKPDICAGLQNNTIRIYQNSNAGGAITSGNFSLQATLNTYTLSSATPYGIEINDLDGDGGNDIMCGYTFGSGTVSVFEKTTPTGFSFATRQDFTTSGLVSSYLAADDFSLDGRTDFVSANYGTTYTVYNSNINAISSEPSGASTVTISGATQTTFSVTLTGPGGVDRIVVVRPSTAVQVMPSDGVGYSYNNNYASAYDLGGGNKVVDGGNSSTSVSVSGLSSNTTYYVDVYYYAGSGCTSNYLTSPHGSNSATTLNYQPTLASISNPSAICQSSSQQSIGLTGIGTGGETQTLTPSASSSNTSLISNGNISFTYTSPNATGTILYTPTSGQSGTSVITVTINDGASNNNTVQKSFTVTVTAPPTTANAGSNMTICASATTLGGNLPTVGTGSWVILYPVTPTVTITSPTQYNSQISNFNIGDSVRLSWTISNSPCSPSVSFVSIKRNSCPMTADFIANQTSFCGTSATVNYTDLTYTGGNTMSSWTWTFQGGTPSTYSTTVAGNPPAISYTAAGTYSVSLTVSSNIPTFDTEDKAGYITITALPGTATTISGPTTVCQGTTTVTYSVTPIAGASTYSWSLPPGASIVGAINTNTISVNYSASASAGNISVKGQNSCGYGSVYNQAIAVNNLPGVTGVISGPSSACQSATGVVFTTTTVSGATGYSWTLPPGASITGGSNTNSVTVSFSASATDGTVDVVGTNACGSGTSSSAYGFSIDSLPVPAGVISGNVTVCPGDTASYGISSLPYANSYSWTVPTGASIVGSSNTESVTVAYSLAASAGNITVRGINACGNGTSANVAITVNPLPSAATAILVNGGNTLICAGSYSVSAYVSGIPGATTGYNWTLPSGFSINSGTNTNSILMNVSSTATSGTISVSGTNSCGNGVASNIVVTVSPLPGLANAITGSSTVCQTQTGVVYTIPAITFATGYSWTSPLGSSIVSGANTNTITVDFSNTAASGYLTAVGTNSCGIGLSVDSFAVTVNPLPDPAGTITGDVTITICPVQTGVSYSVTPVLNATGYTWTVPTGAVIASGSNTNSILVDYSDTALSGNVMVTPTNACGSGTPSLLYVDVDTVQSQSLCIVTVDSTSTKNFLIWEKPVTTAIDSFRIYRDIVGVYTHIGSVKYTSLSEFTDNTNGVNPKTTAYRYKLSSVDACGNESYLSDLHQTIHLQVSPASPWGYNLQWNDYIGFPVTKYRIMRDTLGNGTYHAVDSVGTGIGTWTDTKNYQITDTVGYYIEITHPGGACISSIKFPNPMASNLNLSKSNINRIADTTVTAIIGVNDSYVVSIYPNPNSGLFTLELNTQSGRGEVRIFNMLGEELQHLSVTEKDEKLRINMTGYAKGVYQVQVKSENSIINKKIIIE